MTHNRYRANAEEARENQVYICAVKYSRRQLLHFADHSYILAHIHDLFEETEQVNQSAYSNNNPVVGENSTLLTDKHNNCKNN